MIILFNDDIYNYIDNYKSDLITTIKDNDGNATPEAIMAEAASWIETDREYFINDVVTFDELSTYKKIFIDADLGLWNGHKKIKVLVDSLYDAIIKASEDYNTFYFKNKNATLTLKAIHHDGINTFKFYKVIKGKKYAIKYNDIYRG